MIPFLAILSGVVAVVSYMMATTGSGLESSILVVFAGMLPIAVPIIRDRKWHNPFSSRFLIPFAFWLFFCVGLVPLLLADIQRHFVLVPLVLLGLSGWLFGMYIATASVSSAKKMESKSSSITHHLLFTWVALGILSGLVYLTGSFSADAFHSLSESGRVDAQSKSALFRVGMYSLIPACLLYNVSYMQDTAKRWCMILLNAVVLGLFVLTGNRAPVFILTGSTFLIVMDTLLSNKKATWKLALFLICGLLALTLFGIAGAMRVLADDNVSSYPEIAEENFATVALNQTCDYIRHGANNTATILDAVPELYGYRYGGSYIDPLLTALPGKQFTVDAQLKKSLGMTFSGGGFVPSTLGEAYLNFGICGLFFMPFLLGFAVAAIERKRHISRSMMALWAFSLYYVSVHMVSGVASSSIISWLVALSLISFHLIEIWTRKTTY